MNDCTCLSKFVPEVPELGGGYVHCAITDPWCPIHKAYLFEYESKEE